MRPSHSCAFVLALPLVAAACDGKKGGPAAGGTASTATAAVTATATAPASAAAPIPTAKREMPPRPFPVGSSGPVQPSAPQEQQMMAIGYTIAMVSPQGGDPIVDKAYVEETLKKLEGAIRGADKGKTPPNPARAMSGNRRLHVEMGKGCIDRLPSMLAQRAGSSLKAAYDAGVLVISCHDDKWECHQATRDPADVLCVASPR
jgi:hypothetical protein